MKWITFILLLFIASISFSQVCLDDSVYQTSDLKSGSTSCSDKSNYTVYPYYNMTPIKTIRISFEVFQKSDGSGSFVGTDAQIKNYCQLLIDSANARLANLPALSPTVTSPHVVDSRIRFKLNQVYIYKDDNLYNALCPRSNETSASVHVLADSVYQKKVIQNTALSETEKTGTLHILMFPKGILSGQSDYPIPCPTWVQMRGYDYTYNCDIWATGTSNNAVHQQTTHLIHEICHSLGLNHSFINDGCDDDQAQKYTSNNYMDYTMSINTGIIGSFSECQIATMHYSLMGGNKNIVMTDYISDYCTFDNTQTITIASNQDITWSGAKNLLGDVIVNGKLSILCDMSIPKGGTVTINNGGKLFLTQGKFDNICNDTWGTVEVKNGGYLDLESTTISDYSIVVKSGGTLKINGALVVSGNNSIMIESGGYLCIDSSASIDLVDFNSVINLKPGYLVGINPNIGSSSTCFTTPLTFSKTGNGNINGYSNDIYIQNETISNNRYYTGKNIYIGQNVTSSKSQGAVIITNGANVILDANQNVIFDKNIQINQGVGFEIR